MLAPLVLLACSAGCSKEKMAEVFQQGAEEVGQSIAETTEAVTEVVKQQSGLAGQLELVLDGPVDAPACYASLVSFSSDRPSVLQLSTSGETADEAFPSVLVRAQVPAGTFSELVGKELTAAVYVQTEAGGPIWHSPQGQPVELAITDADEASVQGELVRGTLVSSETGQSLSVTGKFQAVVQ
jgi:hypothetical protein